VPKVLRDRLAPWHAEEIPGLRKGIKKRIVEEGAVKSPKLLNKLKIELGLS
jgi:hypothetical protein